MVERIQPSFAAGEIAPALYARVDLAKYAVALKTCRNFIVRPQGGAFTRPGTEFVCQAKYSDRWTSLIPFSFNTTQSYVLEFGDSYFRVIKDGGQIVDGGVPVEVATPFTPAILESLRYTQSADVLTVTHADIRPRHISRTSHIAWSITEEQLGANIAAPINLAASTIGTVDGGAETFTHAYAVTAVAQNGEESPESTPDSVSHNRLSDTDGKRILLTWDAVAGATSYNVYKDRNGIYGWIGSAGLATFTDDNIRPDTTDTAAKLVDIFTGPSYPAAVAYYEQRRVYAGFTNEPDVLRLSQSGIYNNFNISAPVKDDDAITRAIAADKVQDVRHLVSLEDLLVFTSSSVWKVNAGTSDGLTPTTMQAKRQSDIGASIVVAPVVAKDAVLVVDDGGQTVHDLGYQFAVDRYTSTDLSVLAQHLFDGHEIVAMTWAQRPHKVVWCIRDDGVAVALTYLRDQEVYAWHRHDTDGLFRHVCSIREGGVDAVYFLVEREVGGEAVYYIERLRQRDWLAVEDAWCVDCGLRYDGAPASTISGLGHLEGCEVAILADGNVLPRQTVAAGQVTLGALYSKVVVGLPYTCDLQTLKPDLDGAHGKRQRIVNVTLRVTQTRGLKVGPDADHLSEFKERTNEPYGTATVLRTGDIGPVIIDPLWTNEASLLIRQDNPLPAEVLGIIPEIAIGS